MASTGKRTLRPNVKKPYKNTCGAPAPRNSLLQLEECSNTTRKKAANTINTETLLYTTSGDRLPLGAVNTTSIFSLFIYLTINGPVVWKLP